MTADIIEFNPNAITRTPKSLASDADIAGQIIIFPGVRREHLPPLSARHVAMLQIKFVSLGTALAKDSND